MKQSGSVLQAERWQPSEQYGGLVRKVTFRFLCTSPMCPYDSAMTDWQHVMYDEKEQVLVSEAPVTGAGSPSACWRI
jgi:hypothetical protein